MEKKIYLFAILFIMGVRILAQTATLTFTGKDANGHWVRFHHVIIINQTKNWSETVAWPDTMLTIENGTGIVETVHAPSLQLAQNHPNPFNGTTDVFLTAADAGTMTLEIADVNGRVVIPAMDISTIVRANNHSPQQFRITLAAAGTYVLTVRQNGKTASIKMVNNGGGKRKWGRIYGVCRGE